MSTLGQLCLLGALVGSGYAAFACTAASQRAHRAIGRSGTLAAVASVLALSGVTGVLAWALLVKDFRFAYVAQYSSGSLPWHYSLCALWVGQAGSLLLWAWFLGVLALAYRFWPRREPSPLRQSTFGVLMAYLCLLAAMMVFGADPMEPSIGIPREGAGLSPLLQHPAMLIHPPVVFLGYAAWAIPCALALVALAAGRLDANWVREARPWAVLAWTVLGLGIILGGQWAYEELGWGGYWSWDPVENGSLIPWLSGTALIHCLMVWQYRGALKKTAVALAIGTFGLCNFATFLTRSGIFSSLHAFGQSPIGWMFLVLMVALAAGGGILLLARRARLAPDRPIRSLWAREAIVVISTITLLLLAAVTLVGTLAVPLSGIFLGQKIAVGAAFYDNVLIPTGLLLLGTIAVAPLLRWGAPPTPTGKKMLLLCMGAGGIVAILALAVGIRHPIALGVIWLAALAAVSLLGALTLDVRRRESRGPFFRLLETLRESRRQYAGFLIHVGFVCLAVGVTGSSLGTRRHEAVMGEGQTIQWAGRSIRFARLIKRELPNKFVAEAQLEISRAGDAVETLLPAQHLHLLQNEWTSEVAIHSTWGGDFYTILHGNEGQDRVHLTFVENPMIRWIWLGGWIIGAGALVRLWPGRRRSLPHSAVPPRHSQSTASRGFRCATAVAAVPLARKHVDQGTADTAVARTTHVTD